MALYPSMDAMLRHLLDYMLFKEFDPDLVEFVGEAFYALVILRHSVYVTLAQQLLESQPTLERRIRLKNAFEALTAQMLSSSNAMAKHGGSQEISSTTAVAINGLLDGKEFKAYFNALLKFLMNVRGFLRVR
ncbi:hypothetical protein HK100_001064 [Physocladia obscura]|uniref:Uncharacterized protein n=1 Tax=Physocladia obscura TaxID=109957 RepID=A0AAD5SXM5_9FUNG|nr:hypothetical protein HK100_001064 [Physocladia obscura]